MRMTGYARGKDLQCLYQCTVAPSRGRDDMGAVLLGPCDENANWGRRDYPLRADLIIFDKDDSGAGWLKKSCCKLALTSFTI